MTSVAINAARVDAPYVPGLSTELHRDPRDLWQTMLDTPGKPCDDSDPDRFFPVGFTATSDNARRACRNTATGADCPARAACLAFAIKTHETPDTSGVWGGTTPRERQRLGHLHMRGEL